MGKHAKAQRGKLRASRLLVVTAVVVLLVGGGAFALTELAHSSTRRSTHRTDNSSTHKAPTKATSPSQTALTSADRCPLTDLPAPSGVVPDRPALAIKVGNDPGARPQSGLSKADVVYEVQAEGGITRFIAVFQCQTPPMVGPIRSLRWVDWHVVRQLGNPILVFAGGIIPDIQMVNQQSWLHPVDALDFNGSPFVRITQRVPPENLYGYPSQILSMVGATGKPPVLFDFSSKPPAGGSPVATVSIPFSAPEDVSWTWSPSEGKFLRAYSGQPAYGNGGEQLSATNVVVQVVNAPPGPYNESGPNSLGVHSQTVGSGQVWVLRNGEIYKGIWKRPSLTSTTTYWLPDGHEISLAPGQTWVEVVPNWVHLSYTS